MGGGSISPSLGHLRPRRRHVVDSVKRCQLLDYPDLEGLLCRKLVSRDEQRFGNRRPEHPPESFDGPRAVERPEPDRRHGETRADRRDAKVTRHGELEAGSKTIASNDSYGDFLAGCDCVACCPQRFALMRVGTEPGEDLYVEAGGERLVTRAFDGDIANGRIARQLRELRGQIEQESRRQRIQRSWSIDDEAKASILNHGDELGARGNRLGLAGSRHRVSVSAHG